MARASKLHRFAGQLAGKLSQGKPPALTGEMAAYLEERPESLFESLDGFARHFDDDGEDDSLAAAYLMLTAIRLDYLKHEIDRGYVRANDLLSEFERRLGAMARSGDLPGSALALITAALQEAKLEPGDELLALNEEMLEAEAPGVDPSDIGRLLGQLADEGEGNVFELLDTMDKATHAMPPQLRVLFAEHMVTSGFPVLRDAASLLVLDPVKDIRRDVALLLHRHAEMLSPVSLRRLIAVRTWLPEDERHLVDQLVRETRAKGVVCAGWDAGEASELHASAIDGSGAQGFMIISPAGRRKRLSSVLLKQAVGVLDAWSGEPSPKRAITDMLEEASIATSFHQVSRSYLDQAVCHYLAVGLENGAIPPWGLLQVAETIAATEWRPASLDWRAMLDGMLAELPAGLRDAESTEEILRTSTDWAAADGLSDSWFEDDQDVEELLRTAGQRPPKELVARMLSDIVEPRKLKWAERFAWIALWLKEAAAEPDMAWPSFAILAREVAHGRPLGTIPLMEDIATQTVMVMRG